MFPEVATPGHSLLMLGNRCRRSFFLYMMILDMEKIVDRNRGKENKARVGGDTNRILKRAKEMYFLCSTTHISLYFFTRYSIEYN